jgi:hypothetical protein
MLRTKPGFPFWHIPGSGILYQASAPLFDQTARTDQREHLGVGQRVLFVLVEVCHVGSGSLEASRSRVGIAERDDILWFRCIVGT